MKRTVIEVIKDFLIFIKEKFLKLNFKLNIGKTELITSDKNLMDTDIEIEEGIFIKPKINFR